MKFAFILLCGFIFSFDTNAQHASVQKYIDTYKDVAIREMQRKGVPASIILAQGILETESGNSDLVKRSNNHFGIKCKSNWTGATAYHDDDERGECFRKYNTAEESYRDHSDFLSNSSRYAALFELEKTDYKGWAYGLKKAGYATNPRYPQILISNIERYNLNQYTIEGLKSKETFASGNYINENNEQVTAVIKPAAPVESALPDAGKLTEHNGLRAVFVNKGTSLLAVATKFDIGLKKLLDFNDFSEDGLLDEDQWIYLQRKHKEGKSDLHYSKGETLHEVSQLYGIQLDELSELNDFGDEVIQPNTPVVLKEGVKAPEVMVVTERKVHEVLPKEGLYAISRKYNVTVEEIKNWNNLTSDQLQIGQKLYISK